MRTELMKTCILGFLTTSVITCASPKHTNSVWTLSEKEFNDLTVSEDWYGYRGDRYIMEGAELGTINLDVSLRRVTVNRTDGSIKLAGYVVEHGSRELLPNSDVVIGKVEYTQDGTPHRIVTKKGVISGVNGEFEIEANLEQGDRLFVAHLTYIVKVYDIYKLIHPSVDSDNDNI